MYFVQLTKFGMMMLYCSVSKPELQQRRWCLHLFIDCLYLT